MLSNQVINFEDWEQNCKHNRQDNRTHENDKQWLQDAEQGGDEPVDLPFLAGRRTRQHFLESATRFAARNRWIIIGGNSLLAASDLLIEAPSRTRTVASVTASRIGRFSMTSAEIFSASRIGTPLPARMLRVRVKRPY